MIGAARKGFDPFFAMRRSTSKFARNSLIAVLDSVVDRSDFFLVSGGAEQQAHVHEAFLSDVRQLAADRGRPFRARENIFRGLGHHPRVDQRTASKPVRDDRADVRADPHVEQAFPLAACA